MDFQKKDIYFFHGHNQKNFKELNRQNRKIKMHYYCHLNFDMQETLFNENVVKNFINFLKNFFYIVIFKKF